jgi:hypothetical protein
MDEGARPAKETTRPAISRMPVVVTIAGLGMAVVLVLLGARLAAAPAPTPEVDEPGTRDAPRPVNVIMQSMTYVIAEPCVDVTTDGPGLRVPSARSDCIHFEEGVDRTALHRPRRVHRLRRLRAGVPGQRHLPRGSVPAEWAAYTAHRRAVVQGQGRGRAMQVNEFKPA